MVAFHDAGYIIVSRYLTLLALLATPQFVLSNIKYVSLDSSYRWLVEFGIAVHFRIC
jgi:hypothetical protein